MRALVLDFGGVISRTLFETHDQTEAALGLPAGTLQWRRPFGLASNALWHDMQAGRLSERDDWLQRTRLRRSSTPTRPATGLRADMVEAQSSPW